MMNLFSILHQQGMTIIFVTHDMELVLKYATDVVVMAEGRVVIQTNPEDLFYGEHPQLHIEKPPLVQLVQACLKQGIKLANQRYRNLDELVKEIKRLM
jgi:energy-coupling factor transport system ATP-binding protein